MATFGRSLLSRGRYFRRVVTFGGSLLPRGRSFRDLLTTVILYYYFRRVATERYIERLNSRLKFFDMFKLSFPIGRYVPPLKMLFKPVHLAS